MWGSMEGERSAFDSRGEGSRRIGIVLGGGAMRHARTGEMVFHVGVLDLDRALPPAAVDLDFLAHGITPSPHDPRRYVMFEKHGPGCAIVDIDLATRTGARVDAIPAGAGRQFYGHGVFSADGALLFCTETDVADRSRGWIAVRDGRLN